MARSGVRVRVYRDSRESIQDNDVHSELDTTLAALFETRFEAMWGGGKPIVDAVRLMGVTLPVDQAVFFKHSQLLD